jgi:membrane associated rhomboid family serine protease
MTAPVCVRHPSRETWARCTRCDRPACPACLREASVGYQCVDCVAQGARSQPRANTFAGAGLTSRSVVIPVLIAINTVIFVITVMQAGSLARNTDAQLFEQWGLRPAAVADGAWWRLLTSGFLHIGPIHLAFNMIALWVIGRDLEQVLGRTRFLLVYLVSLLGGSLAVFLFAAENSMTAGASGAVFGLMGGLAVVLLRMRRSPRPALTIILLNVVISFLVPGISILGHLGGLVFGAAVTAGLVYTPEERRSVR